MAISMLKIRRPLGRLIFNMGIAIPGKTVFLIETAPSIASHKFLWYHWGRRYCIWYPGSWAEGRPLSWALSEITRFHKEYVSIWLRYGVTSIACLTWDWYDSTWVRCVLDMASVSFRDANTNVVQETYNIKHYFGIMHCSCYHKSEFHTFSG